MYALRVPFRLRSLFLATHLSNTNFISAKLFRPLSRFIVFFATFVVGTGGGNSPFLAKTIVPNSSGFLFATGFNPIKRHRRVSVRSIFKRRSVDFSLWPFPPPTKKMCPDVTFHVTRLNIYRTRLRAGAYYLKTARRRASAGRTYFITPVTTLVKFANLFGFRTVGRSRIFERPVRASITSTRRRSGSQGTGSK